MTSHLDRAHPRLAGLFSRAAGVYSRKHPTRAIRIVTSTRSEDAQLRAFKAEKSKIDPRVKPSRHNFEPSLALDLWIYKVPRGKQPIGGFWQVKPPGDAGAELILSPSTSWGYDRIQFEYRRLGYELQSWQDGEHEEARLVWGGSWKEGSEIDRWRLPRFFDGPHVQLSSRFCVQEVQRMLSEVLAPDPGAIDGLFGPKTRASLAGFCAAKDIPLDLVPGRKFPLKIGAWDALWRASRGS